MAENIIHLTTNLRYYFFTDLAALCSTFLTFGVKGDEITFLVQIFYRKMMPTSYALNSAMSFSLQKTRTKNG